MNTRCFFVERTGVTRTVPHVCDVQNCDAGPEEEIEWRRTDTGETQFISYYFSPAVFGPGAMWFQEYIDEHDGAMYKGNGSWNNDDGSHLLVYTPGGQWDIDSRASNCDQQNERTHRCWVRRGMPPDVTVDKNGHTCGAGAGSIRAGSFHAMLTNGELIPCPDSV